MNVRPRLLAFLALSGIAAAVGGAPPEPSPGSAAPAAHEAHAHDGAKTRDAQTDVAHARGTPARDAHLRDPHAQDEQARDAHGAAGPVAAPAQRWASDAALREGMRRVQAALAVLHHDQLGHGSPAAAQEQAAQIEAAIRYLFAHCRLAPDADAALHRILLPLLSAAQRLQRDPAQHDAVAAMHAAVAPYPQQFDDPGWPAAPDPAPAAQ